MKIGDSNILRAVAKKVIAESKAATKGVDKVGDRDKINAEIIDRHFKTIQGGYTKSHLIYFIGVARGVLRDPEA